MNERNNKRTNKQTNKRMNDRSKESIKETHLYGTYESDAHNNTLQIKSKQIT